MPALAGALALTPVCVGRCSRMYCVLANGFSFFFCTNKRKTKQKENSPAAFFLPTPALFYAKQKELASLKQLFVFNAPKSISALRPKNKAGIIWSGCTQTSLRSLIVTCHHCFVCHHYSTCHPEQREGSENIHLNERSDVEFSVGETGLRGRSEEHTSELQSR